MQMSDLKAKMHQNRFRLGLRLRPHWGSLQRSPRPPGCMHLRGPTSKGKGVQGRGGARVGKGKKGGRERGERKKGGRRGEEREREGDTCHTNPSLLPAPLSAEDFSPFSHVFGTKSRARVNTAN